MSNLTKLVADKPAIHYHGDIDLPEGVVGPTMSASNIKDILEHSPAFVKAQMEKAKAGESEAPSSVMNFGSAAHSMILGDKPSVSIAIIDSPNFLNPEAKALKKEALEAGLYPILRKTTNKKNTFDLETLYRMKDVYASSRIAQHLKGDENLVEASVYWHDEEIGIWKRARHDLLPSVEALRRGVGIVDYKTTGKSFEDWRRGYLTAQHGWTRMVHYVESVLYYCGIVPNVWFIVQQNFAPFALRYYTMPIGSAYRQLNDGDPEGFETPNLAQELDNPGLIIERFEEATSYCEVAGKKWAKALKTGEWVMPEQAGFFDLTDRGRLSSIPATYPEIIIKND